MHQWSKHGFISDTFWTIQKYSVNTLTCCYIGRYILLYFEHHAHDIFSRPKCILHSSGGNIVLGRGFVRYLWISYVHSRRKLYKWTEGFLLWQSLYKHDIIPLLLTSCTNFHISLTCSCPTPFLSFSPSESPLTSLQAFRWPGEMGRNQAKGSARKVLPICSAHGNKGRSASATWPVQVHTTTCDIVLA